MPQEMSWKVSMGIYTNLIYPELPTGVYLVTLINAKSEATVSKLIKIE